MEQQRRHVGRNVRKARLGAGLTLDSLADQVGSSRQHLIRIEKGDHLPRPKLLAALAAATGTTPEQLESGDDDEEPHRAMSLDDFLRQHVRQLLRDEMKAARQ